MGLFVWGGCDELRRETNEKTSQKGSKKEAKWSQNGAELAKELQNVIESSVFENGRLQGGLRLSVPAANSRSGSTEGHGASGHLFATGVLSVVCGFSSKLDVKKHGSRRKRWREGCKIEKPFRFQSIFRNSGKKRWERCDEI